NKVKTNKTDKKTPLKVFFFVTEVNLFLDNI
ncbi:uncharacterized protein METZ01_LOCUS318325, partial [marine metagenome]